MTTSSGSSEDEVKELAKVLRAIPDFVKQYSDVLLEVIDKICVDDPVIIDWTVPFPRNGRNQTKRSLINYFTTHGGKDEFNAGIIFSFRNSGLELRNGDRFWPETWNLRPIPA
ncbi:hypothetical protein C1646_756534 [Rhizophagus diaphanus]|nr:hypothetical protein C1646_756534 [Rhizophagus diaphanus] [Rhizophagus sp. MUCL 43196]